MWHYLACKSYVNKHQLKCYQPHLPELCLSFRVAVKTNTCSLKRHRVVHCSSLACFVFFCCCFLDSPRRLPLLDARSRRTQLARWPWYSSLHDREEMKICKFDRKKRTCMAWNVWLSRALLHDLPSFDDANGRLCQEGLLRSRNLATMVTWRHTSPLCLVPKAFPLENAPCTTSKQWLQSICRKKESDNRCDFFLWILLETLMHSVLSHLNNCCSFNACQPL